MKTIGLIGGMSWESTAVYYELLNRLARERRGGLHSAELLLWSFDFAEIEALQMAGDWATATDRMVDAARRLARGGADCVVICTNTMHKMADAVQTAVSIPLIHIADPTGKAAVDAGARRPLLFGTRFTMEHDFYKGHLTQHYGLNVVIPDERERTEVHDIIYDELCQGVVRAESKQRYLDVVAAARTRGADGVILGCTEVGLLVQQGDLDIPVFDTTQLHAKAALDFALSD